MERIEHIDSKEVKGQKTITIHLKGGNEPRLMLSPQVRLLLLFFKTHLYSCYLHIRVFFCIIKKKTLVCVINMHVSVLLLCICVLKRHDCINGSMLII
jgi:hypothetical protein